jgi:hypothetical protein
VGEFFKGWRRKAGLVTLALAMVLTAGWMRSTLYYDQFFMQVPRGVLHYVCSENGRIVVESPADRFWDDESFALYSGPIDYQWERVGIPYWSLVLPLTLLSAWLILAKQPKSKTGPN